MYHLCTFYINIYQVTRRGIPFSTPEAIPIRLVIAGSLEPAVRWTGFTTLVPYLTGCRSPLLGWIGGLAEDDALSIVVGGTAAATRRGPG